jgi:hypothetical protein
VLNVEDVEPLLPFYRDLLGFRVSDYGLKPYTAAARGVRAKISLTGCPWLDAVIASE